MRGLFGFLIKKNEYTRLQTMDYEMRHGINGEEDTPVFVRGTTGKRTLASLADFFIVLFVGMIFYAALVNVVTFGPLASAPQQEMSLIIEEQIRSGLQERTNEGSLKNPDQLCYTYAKALVAYDGTGTPNDLFYRFYCTYEAEGKEVMGTLDFNEGIRKSNQDGSLFVGGDASKVAWLKDEIRTPLSAYLAGNEEDAEPINAYRAVKEDFDATFEKAWEVLMTTPYMQERFQIYASSATRYYLSLTAVAVGSFVLSSAIFLFLVPFIHQKGTTIGKKILHLEPRGYDGSPIRPSQILLRGTMDMLGLTIGMPLVPMFIFGVDGFSMPLIAAGNFVLRLSVFFLFGALVLLASLGCVLIRKDHLSLSGLASSTATFTTDMAILATEKEKLRKAKEASRGEAD